MRITLLISVCLITFLYRPVYGESKTSEKEVLEHLETYTKVLHFIESLYVDKNKIGKVDLIKNSIRGMLSGLDPHSIYMPKEAFKEMKIDTSGKFGGIGIRIALKGKYITVIAVLENTPAARKGLKPGDKILAVNGKSIIKSTPSEVVNLIQGTPGSSVELKIKREEKEAFAVSLKREIIKMKSTYAQEIYPNYMLISVRSFQEKSDQQVRKAIQDYLKKNRRIKGLILDLRNNPGGLLDQAVKISDLFLESGVIVTTLGRTNKNKEVEFAHKKGTFSFFPMIVLVNEASASASEIVAGALQDHKRALIMGQPTFGKGSVQTLLELPNGAGLKLTVAKYYTPLNRSIQAKGIQPNVLIPISPPKNKAAKSFVKEKDLKGHFQANDKNEITTSTQDNWSQKINKQFSHDYQLASAIHYLMSFNLFGIDNKAGE